MAFACSTSASSSLDSLPWVLNLLRRSGQAAHGDGDYAKDHGGYAQDLASTAATLAPARQTEEIPQTAKDDPGKLYRDAVDQDEADERAYQT